MIRFLSNLPPEHIARELATALGSDEAPTLGGVAINDDRTVDTTAPHWYSLDPCGDAVLFPHDENGDALRAFDFHATGHAAEVGRSALEHMGAVFPRYIPARWQYVSADGTLTDYDAASEPAPKDTP